jgi:hypothetical protein
MRYYIVKHVDKEGISIAAFQAENDQELVIKMLMAGVPSDAEIHHIETLPYTPEGVCVILGLAFPEGMGEIVDLAAPKE